MFSDVAPISDTALRACRSAASLWWPQLRRWAPAAFGIVVLGLLASQAHKVDWPGAWQTLRQYRLSVLLTALALATISHMLYGCFDLIGRRHIHHQVPVLNTWAIAVTSYAFTLNLGSLLGALATRARLYARAGLDEISTAQVVGISVATNWLGYGLLAGGLFASGAISLPQQAHIGAAALRVIGGLMLLLAAAYVLACALSHGREWSIRKKRLRLPSPRLAMVQLAISTTNWLLMGLVMHVLLQGQVTFATTLGVLLAASIVGVFMPIPAGLGILEAVYLALLSGAVKQGALLGAVLAYRAVYYLLPLLGGLLLYAVLERHAAAHAANPGGEVRRVA